METFAMNCVENGASAGNSDFVEVGSELLWYSEFFSSKPFDLLDNINEVQIDVGIDGLSVFKSSNKVLWPILGSIVGFPKERPFTIACFSGINKPCNVNDYMSKFCVEASHLHICVFLKPKEILHVRYEVI